MDDTRPDKPSKSQRKREMHALQELGASLVGLSPERLARMDLPEELRGAILDAHKTTKHEALRRQIQYIGRLMRDVDAAPIREALAELNGTSQAQTALHHRLERLRDRLLEDESVLDEIIIAAEDRQRLRQLRRNALKEQQAGKPPRSYRELFRLLRDLLDNPKD